MTFRPKSTSIIKNQPVCPGCKSAKTEIFYMVENVPVHSVHLLSSQDQALNYPKGDIALGVCHVCGLITNFAYDPNVQDYNQGYEATQSYSPTFNAFHVELAERLIDQYALHQKNILEIGCGQGEFLKLLCDLGDNQGIGFDPAYSGESTDLLDEKKITLIKDFYSERYRAFQADFLCCKMTLEHIFQPAEFVKMIRKSIGDNTNTIVFFQVPDVTRILQEVAFWDIYYEHCSYFSVGSLSHLFRNSGFEILHQNIVYDGQYLILEAKPATHPLPTHTDRNIYLAALLDAVSNFKEKYPSVLNTWGQKLKEIKQNGQRTVIWGAGSKGVAFLTTLNIRDEIAYAIDVNPLKQGTYLAGTGQKIEAPAFLKEYRPDVVIVMNAIYQAEIQRDLDRMNLASKLITV